MPGHVQGGRRVSVDFLRAILRELDVFGPLKQAAGYWLTSVIAFAIGVVLTDPSPFSHWQAAGVLLMGFPLAFIYAEYSRDPDPGSGSASIDVASDKGSERRAVIGLISIAGVFGGGLILFTSGFSLTNTVVPGAYVGTALLSAWYQWWRVPQRQDLNVRDGLFWPVLTLIFASSLTGALWISSSIPVSIAMIFALGIVPFVTSRIPGPAMAISGTAVFSVLFLAGIISLEGVSTWLSERVDDSVRPLLNLLSAVVAIAGLLAAMEGWRWTDDLRRFEAVRPMSTAIGGVERERWKKHYRSVAVAIAVFSVLSSYLYLAAGLGFTFLIVLFVITHVTLVLTVGFQNISQVALPTWIGLLLRESATNPSWAMIKTKLGFLMLLGILAVGYFDLGALPETLSGAFLESANTLLGAIAVGAGIAVTGTGLSSWWKAWTCIEDSAGDSAERTAKAVYPLAAVTSLAFLVVPGALILVLAPHLTLVPKIRVLVTYGLILLLWLLVLSADGVRKEIWVFITATRPPTTTLLLLAVGVPALLRLESVGLAAVLAVPFALAAAAAFLLNDLADIERDRISKPYRPFVRFGVEAFRARLFAYGLLVVALLIVAVHQLGATVATLQVVAMLGALTYTPVVDRFSRFKPFAAAVLATLPIATVVLSIPRYGLADLIFVSSVCSYLAGREVLMDVLDVEGDSATGRITLALRLGEPAASLLGVLLQVGALAVVAWLLIGLGMALVALILLLAGLSLVCYFLLGSIAGRRVSIRLQWVPMLLGAIAFLA